MFKTILTKVTPTWYTKGKLGTKEEQGMFVKGATVTGLGLTMVGGTFSIDIVLKIGIAIFIAFMIYATAVAKLGRKA